MKKVLCAMLAVLVWSAGAWGAVTINAENFPDETFRSYVSSNFDTNSDGTLSDEEISGVTSISVTNRNVNSLKGIEYFTALTILNCYYNELTELDVSNNTALTYLSCGANQLTELDVSNNTALTTLWCDGNQPTELDVSNNTALERLSCGANQLTELDVSNNTVLRELDCSDNNLTELDVSNNTALTELICYDNQLTELDVSSNTELVELNCYKNELTELNISHNTALTVLLCSQNQLTELDVSTNTALTYIDCYLNQLTDLDVSNNAALIELNCSGNQLTELDVSNNTTLLRLECWSNNLIDLDVNNNIALGALNCNNNQIKELDVSNNSTLNDLRCYLNQLTELDVSNNTSLTSLACSEQTLTLSADSFDTTSDTSYPYSLTLTNLNASIDIARVSDLNVTNSDDTSATFSQSGATLYLAAIPSTITYSYDTQLSGDTIYMDVTITISGDKGTSTTPSTPSNLALNLTPSTQTATRSSTISTITISADNLSGDLVWSFAVSGDYALGLTSSDLAITGTIPAATSAGTYTIVITAYDSRNEPVTSTASITVTTANAATGITGITINTPASKTASFTSIGGTLTATATASGTASGDITWTVSSSEGASVSTSSNGSTATFTITISPNNTYTDRTDTVTITAQDNAASFSDAITITVYAVSQTASISDRYRFSMTESLLRGLLAAFAGMTEDDIYQLTDSEIISDSWSLTEADAQELAGRGERAVANIPSIRPQNTGVYVMRVSLSNELAGTKINLHGISDVSASDLQNMQYTFLDENGNVIDTIPEDKNVYVAVSTTAGSEAQGVITAPSTLALGTIVPIDSESQESLREVIAETLSIDVVEVNFITDENILPAPDPTQDMTDKAASDNYSIVGKLGIISVDRDGWYVFQVILSDDLFRQLQSVDVSDINVYDFPVDFYDSEAKSAIINGLLGTWELMTMSGQKLEKVTAPMFLMGGLLNAGQPLTLFIAKAILALLTGGLGACNAGLGLVCMSAVAFLIIRRKRR